jgi:hypothetical protein
MDHPADAHRHADWYSVLGLDTAAPTEQITAAVEKLARQANALALTAPERARQLRDQVRAIKQDLLSGPERRQLYDRQLAAASRPGPPGPAAGGLPFTHRVTPQPQGNRAAGLMARFTQFLQAGWTCSNCGYGALPNEKFCSKCGGKIQSGVGGQAGRAPADTAPSAASPAAGPAPKPAPCPACGSEIAPGDLFCTKCGKLRA